jgi:hypothetical protein
MLIEWVHFPYIYIYIYIYNRKLKHIIEPEGIMKRPPCQNRVNDMFQILQVGQVHSAPRLEIEINFLLSQPIWSTAVKWGVMDVKTWTISVVGKYSPNHLRMVSREYLEKFAHHLMRETGILQKISTDIISYPNMYEGSYGMNQFRDYRNIPKRFESRYLAFDPRNLRINSYGPTHSRMTVKASSITRWRLSGIK